jgi:hypothetical protein
MNNNFQIKKKNRPLTPDEQTGMTNLLSGLNMLRELAIKKPSAASVSSCGDVLTIHPIP